MDGNVEQEICNNCKKEIPQPNYVMHTMHCARNITLCKQCNEPIPKSQFADHEKSCNPPKPKKPSPPPIALEKSSYFQTRKAVEDKKIEARRERYMQRLDKLVDSGHSFRENSPSTMASPSPPVGYSRENSYGYSPRNSNDPGRSRQNGYNFPATSSTPELKKEPLVKPRSVQTNFAQPRQPEPKFDQPKPMQQPHGAAPVGKFEDKSSGLLACKYCDLELPKLDLEEHENYCGSRTDKCMECGELVMFKDKQAHMSSNHSAAARRSNIGRDSRPLWDSDSQRSEIASGESSVRRPAPFRPLGTFDYDPMPYLPSAYQAPTAGGVKKKEGESYKEISRRLDCPAPQPPAYRRRNPPTELVIPCEFCGVPVPHEDLIEHETGCRPDLARYTPRNRARFSPERDDHLTGPSSPDVELPCPAPQPSANRRRRNPPTELVIPCEFCGVPVPQEDIIEHETGCRPDLARYTPRNRARFSPERDDHLAASGSPDVELPCEFCGDMIPASQLYSHQIRCN